MDYHHLPTKPGVYLFKDREDHILYVGKAINLKSRVGSYFTGNLLDRPWVAVMIDSIKSIEKIIVNNEVEALMLEATPLKQHQPKYNIKLTDDKSYPYIRLTPNEPLPRLQVVRTRPNDKAKYFGPYLSGRTARIICELIREVYGVHISNRLLTKQSRSCFICQLADRPCPLTNEDNWESYRHGVVKAIDFLQGKQYELVKTITIRMKEAAMKQRFELAAKLRDQLQAAKLIATKQQVISSNDIGDYDAVGVYAIKNQAAISILQIRQGRVVRQSNHFLTIGTSDSIAAILRQYIISYYWQLSNLPPLTVIPVELDDQQVIAKWLKTISALGAYELRSVQRGEKRRVIALATKNAEQALETRLLSANRQVHGLIALKELLELPLIPGRIEAIDISNLGTSETVGATVCFIDGQPAKDQYRRYKIKTVEGQNDFAMIEEVMKRRLADTSRPLPDLLIIDGGAEQLKAALKGADSRIKNLESREGIPTSQLLEARSEKPIIIALAKKPDRIYLPNKRLPLSVGRGDKGLLLLAQIRDETHRFVISYHRHRQRQKSLDIS